MNTYVIVIEVEKDEDVFSIFERTNARGLDLNIGDLLKNYIFSKNLEEAEEKWDTIINNSQNSLQRMLKYFWISRKGHILQSQLYRNLKSRAKEKGIEPFIEELYEFSKYYKTVTSLDQEEVRTWLEEENLMSISSNENYYQRICNVFQVYPYIYSMFKFYKKSKCKDTNILLEILEALEKYHFVNNVVSQRIGNEVEKFYAERAMEFFNYSIKQNFKEKINTFKLDLKKKKSSKEEFESNFIESISYNSKNIPLINYIFDRINNFGAKGGQRVKIYSPEKSFKLRNYNIEHILPQDRKGLSEKESSEIIDSIGNLLVIPRHSNSEFGNKTLIEKYNMLF